MFLYLIRHREAEQKIVGPVPPLTGKGRNDERIIPGLINQ